MPIPEVDRVTWKNFLETLTWRQGEHVSLLGPTGGGKTTLALELLPFRKYVVVFSTKAEDPTLNRLRADGFTRIQQWPPRPELEKILFWPVVEHQGDLLNQKRVMRSALTEVMRSGRWCVYIDELWWVAHYLKLGGWVEPLWYQGRSLKLSLVAGTQRPAFVPLAMYDQATHLFLWKDSDARNLKRLSEIGCGINSFHLKQILLGMGEHDVLYVNTRTKELAITNVEGG